MKLPVTVDPPRYHDAVIFDLDGALIDDPRLFGGAMVELARKLRGGGVATAAHGPTRAFRTC